MKKQYEVLKWASLFLEKYNRESRVAEILLQHHLQATRSEFYMNMQEAIPEAITKKYQADIENHAITGIPVQHLMGYEVFYGRAFSVNKHVLIPRPETEELVQQVIKVAKNSKVKQPVIADIGAGSGIIAITLAQELPNAKVYATDISEDALKTAKKNAEQLQADVTFLRGDFLGPLINKHIETDIIVSNPPYIASSEKAAMSDTVINFDPELALFAEEEGLAAYKKIITQSTKITKPESALAFEIGYLQGESVSELIKRAYPETAVQIIQDINQKDRIVFAKLK
ncbi:protein-(glutamine-N5) methyltransferase, release factor-specific [Virgibacillus indicus]|uniref:Release factor glutamine methyltransferase n=1 Tax=Virgibacillus indicus TaxID=2024554 RepID=A0A265N9H0_9BACI|nr:peptide chain release factor N(5)-glutamine methyltransferase [Virgibacillus indicus]OZU88455.1 protein-(glutamine-N5) methyltransferase, release factor-specific [Virgibacillus indicus]